MNPLFIPSPSQGVWHLGPLPIRAYALAIILGVVVAVWFGDKRWVARGGRAGEIGDIALWAVPAGLVGARLWHVATDHDLYFGSGGRPIGAIEIWHGGLGIWGAIMGGLLGAWFYCRRHGILRPAAGGRARTRPAAGAGDRTVRQLLQPGALRPAHDAAVGPGDRRGAPPARATGTTRPSTRRSSTRRCGTSPGSALLLWLDRRFRLGHGRVFAVYVMLYTVGPRLDRDPAHRPHRAEQRAGGVRWDVWISIVLFCWRAVYFVWSARKHPGREASPYVADEGPGGRAAGLTRTVLLYADPSAWAKVVPAPACSYSVQIDRTHRRS